METNKGDKTCIWQQMTIKGKLGLCSIQIWERLKIAVVTAHKIALAVGWEMSV